MKVFCTLYFSYLQALGIESDREIAELVCGSDPEYLELFSPSLEDSAGLRIYTQKQALDYIGAKVRVTQRGSRAGIKPNWGEEARELLATTVLAHVPVEADAQGVHNFRPKAIYVAIMVRRAIQAVKDGGIVDDRDFVGNKRLELYDNVVFLTLFVGLDNYYLFYLRIYSSLGPLL